MKKNNNNTYYLNRHSCFLLQYHLVLVTKYRKPIINNDLEKFLINYTNTYFSERDFHLLEINTNIDHIHILFECGTNVNLSQFINAFKSASSRNIRKNFQQQLNKYYWKPYFLSHSYFICTVSERNTKIVEEYIKNQKVE